MVNNKEVQQRYEKVRKTRYTRVSLNIPKEKYFDMQSFMELNNFPNMTNFIIAAIDYYMYNYTE